ncbi:SDR family oxidoreductase [Kordiimonas aquimaris]|uniref:SDR family oxidoreductase n=1 Tax=Kordiimonas aquimaris TaxID=707591 RepID=UPI0021D30E62|nr:SDR family oxidoreductase [Kordiimonas aquimaris]
MAKQANIPYHTALVTGGAARIGKAIVLKLADMGIAVAIHHRSSEQAASALANEIRENGGTAVTIEGDLAESNNYASIVNKAATSLGSPIDVLVNNASVFEDDTLESLSVEAWNKHQNVNLRAPIFLAKEMVSALESGQKATVINMIDQRVLKLNPQFFSYTTSKAGLWTVTRTMAQHFAPNVRVNAIGPGPTLGNEFQSENDFMNEAASVPLGQGPSLTEITTAIEFLLATPSMTGQMLTLDGGQHLAWQTQDIVVE